MRIISIPVVFLILATLKGSYSEPAQDNDVFDLEYAIGSNDYFEKLTSFNLRKLRESHNAHLAMTQQYQQQSSASVSSIPFSLNIYSESISSKTRDRLLNELKTAVTPLYRVRLCRKSSCVASTFINLNNLLATSDIQLNLTIHLNSNNNVNSITLKNDLSNLRSRSSQYLENNDNDYTLTINANLLTAKPANTPDTQTYVEKVKKEIEAKSESAKEGNKSFFTKYWYYIVPFVVIVFISSFLNPEQAAASG